MCREVATTKPNGFSKPSSRIKMLRRGPPAKQQRFSLLKKPLLRPKDSNMRMPIVAGNWKMFKSPGEAVEFVNALLPRIRDYDKVERVVCPPYIDIPGVQACLANSHIKVGAQNLHWEKQDAYSGSISAPMLKVQC